MEDKSVMLFIRLTAKSLTNFSHSNLFYCVAELANNTEKIGVCINGYLLPKRVSADIETLPLTASDAVTVYTVCKKQRLHILTAFVILSWNM